LSVVSAGVASLAGCAGLGSTDPDGTEPGATETGEPSTPTGTASLTDTPDPGVSLIPQGPDETPPDELIVFPATLQEPLRTAAAGDEPVRARVGMIHDRPGSSPVLPGLVGDTVAIAGTDDQDGHYRIDGDSGVYYEWLVGADAVDAIPEDATVRTVASLSEPRRRVVREAIDTGTRRTIEPQTALGTWVRRTFIGGYWRTDEGVYRGREIQQTDAAFFSDVVWYVLALSPVTAEDSDVAAEDGDGDGSDPVTTLRFPNLPTADHERIRSALGDTHSGAELDAASPQLRALATDDTHMITHVSVFDLQVG
jgi:hypothetical protein